MSHNEWIRYIVLLLFCAYHSKTDIEEKRIANRSVLLTACIGLLLALSSMSKVIFISCMIAGVAGFLISFFLAWLSKGGIGMGDVKLLGAAGLYLGIVSLEYAVFWSLVYLLLFGAVQWLRKKATTKTEYPYAPFFTAGVFTAMCMQIIA